MFETLLGGRSTISRLVFIQSLDTGSQGLIRSAAFSPTRRVSLSQWPTPQQNLL